MEWCAVHKKHCDNPKDCIAQAVAILHDPADFIIEKSIVMQPSWHNSRINYRLKHWKSDINRYEFVGDEFWLNNIYSRLRNDFGLINPQEDVAVVDLTDF